MGSKSSSGKGLAVLALIIGASGLGLGIFSYMQIQTGVIAPDSSISIIVGLWESLYRDMDNPDFNTARDWLIEVGDSEVYNSNYVNLDQSAQHSNTRFHLVKSGWYRVNIIMRWENMDSSYYYGFWVWKNDTLFMTPGYPVPEGIYLQVNIHFYISSDGNDYYDFNCYCLHDDFLISSQQVRNQLTIEYIGEY